MIYDSIFENVCVWIEKKFKNQSMFVRYEVWHQKCITKNDIMTRLIIAKLIVLQIFNYIIVLHVQWYE